MLGHYGNRELAWGPLGSQEKDLPQLYLSTIRLQQALRPAPAPHAHLLGHPPVHDAGDQGAMLRDRHLNTATAFIADQHFSLERAWWDHLPGPGNTGVLWHEGFQETGIRRWCMTLWNAQAARALPDDHELLVGTLRKASGLPVPKFGWTHRRWKHHRPHVHHGRSHSTRRPPAHHKAILHRPGFIIYHVSTRPSADATW